MRPALLILLAALLFGAATPAGKSLLSHVPPLQLAGWFYLGAALGVFPWVLRSGRPTRQTRTNILRLLGAVIFGGVLGPVALLFGLRLASASSVSLWLNLELVATAVLGVLWFRDHLGRGGWLATAGVVASGVWLALEEGPAGWSAAALVAAACVCWGVDNHLTALIDELTPSQTTFCKGLFAGCFNLGLAAFLGQSWPGPGTAGLALGVGAVAYGASVALYVAGAQQLGATRAQLFFATAPFFGAALSWLALGEALTPTHAWTALILAGSLALLFADRHEHRHHHPALEHEHSHRHDDGHHTHTHPGLDPRRRHSHRHRHEPIAHAHPHWPDLHHRHRHGEESGG